MRSLVPVAAMLLAAGCVTESNLKPSMEAQVLQGDKDTAVAESSGVTLVADGAAWKGSPSNLERALTPVYVRLENQSGRTLRIRYEDFSLVGTESRFSYSALPPFTLRQPVASSSSVEGTLEGTGGSGSGAVYIGAGPAWRTGSWSYGPRGAWGSPFYPYYGPYYPGPYTTYQCEEPLPTRDMLQKALPEGTLADGGTVQGFIYFQVVTGRENGVMLQARPVDANSGESLGTLDIPFRVGKS
ncbi:MULTISPECIES: hypothetical protein [Myxococcus]|uniref:Lipoprotein n=1 Tax=Myxococcus llanfairpwllgwyngyllgogerychwyrndrobwllllantysiliogogogochensis TaxID=2590453 RepID=A0A540X9C4_9BACT|nr:MULTISPECIES: hypothetical protein [Myxococcus]NTX02605.1 hypothetical protein [Myxococcus sp. CA040A]TQF17895.1 hypothetical protein FJV41_00680 [Myxococcus llanfairpwllgwyngyllgogerychwyrndrobwllllantysiliogogogochensis]